MFDQDHGLQVPKFRRTALLRLTVGMVCAVSASCDSVQFYQKRLLADPIMAFADSPTEIHFMTKNTYSREGSVGGIGSSAGGGCGCY